MNENFAVLDNRSIALLIENVEREIDVKIYYGKIAKNDTNYFFVGTNIKINVTLDNDKLNRIKKIDSEMKLKVPLLKDCEYFLWLTMESLPNENKESLKHTGIHWEE